ncbi:CpsD/CapB family tyrosine-protein kinase [Clostridium sp. CF011]|uniref:CpsD/CapB family tyrosine-protein kinase n=1 Tax=Clostridium sp. CF011 TaxID=2843318 RepID=UPI001C0CABE4|nr:CpsD/CapB family tyrosine-protein kinase [Clostridium sp. CF011]MBU3093174.1 CpsD/CapB family tyrosine-protein kinase [Clostridium sp. CF011]WAG69321.1 CpsD/CapB family tyrosine-protein kinase [Clostridium sp. CF011]
MKGLGLITFKKPNIPIAEAYRTLRTNIQFSSFDKKIKTLLVTSSGPGEGKTTTASNLAIVMAQGGSKTLLIDCDQRKPNVHMVFGCSNAEGLSNILVDKNEVDINKCIQKTEITNLYILASGTKLPNPAEFLGSAKMKNLIEELKEIYDFIILDTPPIILVTDAQILAQYTDGCLLVISSGEAERDSVIKSKGLLEKVNAKILGVVINKLDLKKSGY